MSDGVLKIGPDIRTGPEWKPLKEFNNYFPVWIFVIDLNDDNTIIAEGEIDYANAEHRKYLGKVTFWALSHHYSVETVAKKDVEKE